MECYDELLENAPDLALDVVLAALDHSNGDEEIGRLAAGPLEDLVVKRGVAVIDRIEIEAANNQRFRLALSGIWSQGTSGSEVWQRVQDAVRCGPWLDDDPRTPQGRGRFTKPEE